MCGRTIAFSSAARPTPSVVAGFILTCSQAGSTQFHHLLRYSLAFLVLAPSCWRATELRCFTRRRWMIGTSRHTKKTAVHTALASRADKYGRCVDRCMSGLCERASQRTMLRVGRGSHGSFACKFPLVSTRSRSDTVAPPTRSAYKRRDGSWSHAGVLSCQIPMGECSWKAEAMSGIPAASSVPAMT